MLVAHLLRPRAKEVHPGVALPGQVRLDKGPKEEMKWRVQDWQQQTFAGSQLAGEVEDSPNLFTLRRGSRTLRLGVLTLPAPAPATLARGLHEGLQRCVGQGRVQVSGSLHNQAHLSGRPAATQRNWTSTRGRREACRPLHGCRRRRHWCRRRRRRRRRCCSRCFFSPAGSSNRRRGGGSQGVAPPILFGRSSHPPAHSGHHEQAGLEEGRERAGSSSSVLRRRNKSMILFHPGHEDSWKRRPAGGVACVSSCPVGVAHRLPQRS